MDPYVCIAVQSTPQSKYWNNPSGWREIVSFLKDAGYRVICIDQKPTHGTASSGPIYRTAPKTKPATGRCKIARAGSSTLNSSSGSPADYHGSPGRSERPS